MEKGHDLLRGRGTFVKAVAAARGVAAEGVAIGLQDPWRRPRLCVPSVG